MEGINPTLDFILHLKFGLERGQSVKTAAKIFLKHSKSELATVINRWILLAESGTQPEMLIESVKSPYAQAAIRIFDRGLQGQTIYPAIILMEQELNEATKSEIESFIAVLPMKMLIPLLLFQFPAFLILLFGPLLQDILRSF